MIRIAHIEPQVYRIPIDTPVITSFGVMRDRPALFLRVVDEDGAEGWGETWCNFPSVGAEHRARLISEVLAPYVVGHTWDGPAEVYETLVSRTEVLAIQSGEPGPIAQAIAGIDLALWDLSARRAGEPLYRHLGGRTAASVPVYASGLNADGPEKLAALKHKEGYRSFKLKVGFGARTDLRNLEAMRKTLGDDTPLMIDANQAWDLGTAEAMAKACAAYAPLWLEEPLRADAPAKQWSKLAQRSPIALAAGENIRGREAFGHAISNMGLRYLQPDVSKWGGLTACVGICRTAIDAGLIYCPHWLGGGIGLAASLHLLAATGGGGMLEIDANPNPLRECILDQIGGMMAGRIPVPSAPGLGILPPLDDLLRYRVAI